jgi:hypothetical protein
MENYMISYESLKMDYYFCPNHRTETFSIDLNMCYCKYKNNIKTFVYLLWSEKSQTSGRLLCLFLQVYIDINLNTPEKIINFQSKLIYILNRI